jgi:xanthine dehydrogenase YagS FAD-binding subunit
MKPVTFIDCPDLSTAVDESSKHGARLIAGGSDLLGELKEGTVGYDRLVSLAGIDGLRGITRTDDGLRLGALTTLTELEFSSDLTGPYHVLADAARGVATPEIRNQGTLGGNLCQRPRCLHYRHGLVNCLKKGGDGCPALDTPYQSYLSVFGGAGCFAVHASDMAVPLVALNATVSIEGPEGERSLPLDDFLVGPEVSVERENVLRPGEILTAVAVPSAPNEWSGSYSKWRTRTAGDFPIVSLAFGCSIEEGRMTGVRVVMGGVAPTPRHSPEAESVLEGTAPGESIAESAADAAVASATPLPDNSFKLDGVRALLVRAVSRLAIS